MYKIIKLVSFLIRQFLLPNPFEQMEHAFWINLAVEPFIHVVTYFIVGQFYERDSLPAIGSFLYLLFYGIHTGLLILMGVFHWNIAAIAIIVALYIFILAVASRLTESIRH